MEWIPMEANPDVMNKFLHKIGVPKEIQVSDVYSLEPDMLPFISQPTVSLILLFPCDDIYKQHLEQQKEEITNKGQTVSKNVYFVKQYLPNVCGTMALIHSISNIDIELESGCLKNFLTKTENKTPQERGTILQTEEDIIKAHKEVALEGQSAPPGEDEPILYHYLAFVEKDGHLYELDGTKDYPVNHGSCSKETFLEDAARVCRDFMKCNPDNTNFTVIAMSKE